MTEYLTTKELAELLRIKERKVYDLAASRHHAAIGHRGGKFKLYDMGSTNGTFVDGEQVSEATIQHGSEVRIGETVFTFWTS